jgi:hypothetical protein
MNKREEYAREMFAQAMNRHGAAKQDGWVPDLARFDKWIADIDQARAAGQYDTAALLCASWPPRRNEK